jgi:hypothetical protein
VYIPAYTLWLLTLYHSFILCSAFYPPSPKPSEQKRLSQYEAKSRTKGTLEYPQKVHGRRYIKKKICYKTPKTNQIIVIKSLIRARVGNGHDQDISSANLGQLIHYRSNPLLLHHRANSNPVLLLERGDSRRTLAGGDLRRDGQLGARNVVLAQDELLGGDDTAQTRGEESEDVAVGFAGLDQHRSTRDDGVDGFQAGCLHGLTRL